MSGSDAPDAGHAGTGARIERPRRERPSTEPAREELDCILCEAADTRASYVIHLRSRSLPSLTHS
jgi:hypothetical protein